MYPGIREWTEEWFAGSLSQGSQGISRSPLDLIFPMIKKPDETVNVSLIFHRFDIHDTSHRKTNLANTTIISRILYI
jgi:hypothetical protein